MRYAAKYDALCACLRELGSVAVAFSAGVDSTLLLKAAHDVLGDRSAAITVRSRFVPKREQEEANAFCRAEGIRLIPLDVDVLAVPGVRENPANRCYLCKKALFSRIIAAAKSEGFAAVAEGSNADDLGDYRPGMAAIRELGIRSPLLEAGLTKAEIRGLSRDLGLPTWDKPAMACLATRFPTGTSLTGEGLARVEAAEDLLRDLGFRQLRVRVHGELARVELEGGEILRLTDPALRAQVDRGLRDLGFRFVCLDLAGYRMGSMNPAASHK
jgi:uncharacterized protein